MVDQHRANLIETQEPGSWKSREVEGNWKDFSYTEIVDWGLEGRELWPGKFPGACCVELGVPLSVF